MLLFIFSALILYLCIMFIGGTLTIIYRLKYNKNIKDLNNCYCDNCNHILNNWESNLPLINYIILKGKCQYCKTKISIYHPFLEFTLGFMLFVFYIKIITWSF